MSKQPEMIVRCKAFAGEGVRRNRIMVDGDIVRVWDSAAGHYTACHSLSARALNRIRDEVTS